MNKKVILFGSGAYGLKALELLGRDNIYAFCDNACKSDGTKYGVAYLTFSSMKRIIETKNPVFSMLSSVKCRNSQEINDFSTLSDTLFYPLSQNQKYLQSGFHPNPEGYRKSTVRLDNC